jgi:hypothetical protein
MTACGGGSSTPPGLTTVTTSTADATGDATAPSGGIAWDITNVATSRATTGATSLNVSITFAQLISSASLPPPGAALATATQLGAVVLISTGTPGNTVNNLAGCVGNPQFPNVNYIVDPGLIAPPGRRSDGNFAIVNNSTSAVSGEASAAFTGPNTLTYSVPLAAIGGGSGAVQIAVVAANGAAGPGNPSITDCAPNATYIST